MNRPVRHADLVARALGALSGEERARVDRALASDPALRREFEEIAGHLLQYDQLPPAPPAPPFARVAAALDDEAKPDLGVLRLVGARRQRRWLAPAVAAAALLLIGLVLYDSLTLRTTDEALRLVPGVGLEVVRNGRAEPAPTGSTLAARPGDVLRSAAPAEARLGERVRVVLDAGARLALATEDEVTLEQGRAWFEVAPGPFVVRTPHGPVRVVGTAFEVDVRSGTLEVAVAHGSVIADGREVLAEQRLTSGRVARDAVGAGAWMSRPTLRLSNGAAPHRLGQPIELTLELANPGQVPLVVPAPAAARTALWLSFETADGRVVGELPVFESNVTSGRELLRPGRALELGPGARRALSLKILPPVGSPGAYRCRALYRPAGQPGVLSTPLDIEVR